MRRSLILLTGCMGLTAFSAMASNEFEGPLRALAGAELSVFATEPDVIDALRQQNARNANVTQDEIDSLDQAWRAETAASDKPMIDAILAHPGSVRLRDLKESMSGMVTEVFVTDSHGLNVIQSDITSDYWQGDEEKWTMTYGKPAGTVHLGEVELDESTQAYQSQISIPVVDPDSGEALGAVTIGIDLSMLQ